MLTPYEGTRLFLKVYGLCVSELFHACQAEPYHILRAWPYLKGV